MSKKLCTECQHSESDPRFKSLGLECGRPDSTTGGELTFKNCVLQRQGGYFKCRVMGFCGKGARFFEKKEA